jgi:hypothetical protein
MNNLFPPHKDIHEAYDLKGSTIGRIVPLAKLEQNPRAVQKDLNWIDSGKVLELGPEKRALLTEQLRRDSEMLKDLGVMDYSLLVGLHWGDRGNRENVRSNTLRVFEVRFALFCLQCSFRIDARLLHSPRFHLSDVKPPKQNTGAPQRQLPCAASCMRPIHTT